MLDLFAGAFSAVGEVHLNAKTSAVAVIDQAKNGITCLGYLRRVQAVAFLLAVLVRGLILRAMMRLMPIMLMSVVPLTIAFVVSMMFVTLGLMIIAFMLASMMRFMAMMCVMALVRLVFMVFTVMIVLLVGRLFCCLFLLSGYRLLEWIGLGLLRCSGFGFGCITEGFCFSF